MAILKPAVSFFMLLFETHVVSARILRLDVSDSLISDGVEAVSIQPPLFNLIVSRSCVHFYGFFPCADNIGGYIFQTVVYQYLLIIGGRLITRGSKTIFNIIGTGVYGATVFRILTVLPKMVMVIVSGVLKSKVDAQDSVSFGVGVYAGSTVFNLTLLWGMCVILGREDFANPATPNSSVSIPRKFEEILSRLKDTGARTDEKTCYTAGIMLLSLIPYILLQLTYAFDSSFGSRMVVLVTLIVSTLMLLSYFLYQIFNPWIQERSLEYSKYENLLVGFLQHVQNSTKEKLVDENGQPNISVIKGVFHQMDEDADRCITDHELEKLITEIPESGNVEVDKGYGVCEMLKAFDLNRDGRIVEEEFVQGLCKWINEASQFAKNGDCTSSNIPEEASACCETVKYDIIHTYSATYMIETDSMHPKFTFKIKRIKKAEIQHLMARILKHMQKEALRAEHLITDEGRPNVERIKALFEQFDTDKNKSLSQPELEKLINTTVKTGCAQLNLKEMVNKFRKDFDRDGDGVIGEQEFVHGMTKWLNIAMDVTRCKDENRFIDEYDKIIWGELDRLVYGVGENAEKTKTWSLIKSSGDVILGIVMLTFLSGPLQKSMQQFSDAIGVPAFFVSFVVVPVAMNARSALRAVFPASRKTSKTSSLTFSEIYGGVVMNNMMGLCTLAAIVYVKGLDWDYSAEVLTIMGVCAVVGILGCSQTTYPLWTCIFAFLFYPFSLLMYYILHYVLGWD